MTAYAAAMAGQMAHHDRRPPGEAGLEGLEPSTPGFGVRRGHFRPVLHSVELS
jgi:hypothetical protein